MNIKVIYKELSEFKPTFNNSYEENIIHAAFIVDGPVHKLNPEILYICSCEEAINQIIELNCPGNVIFLYNYNFNRHDFGKLNFLSMEGKHLIYNVYDIICNILSTHNDLENKKMRLTNILLEGKGLQQLVEEGKKIFSNPIMVCDLANNILAYNKNATVNNLTWSKLEDNKLQTYERLRNFHKSGVFEKLYKSMEPVIERFDYSPHRWMAYKITIQGNLAGHVAIVEAESSYHENDIELLKFFSEIISNELEKHIFQNYIYENSYEYILSDLLNGSAKEKQVIESQLKNLNKMLCKNLYLITIRNKQVNSKQMQLKYIKSIIDNILNVPMSLIYNNDLVVLISHDKDEFLPEKYYNQLVHLMAEYNLYAGVSELFSDISQLKKHYNQAIIAVKLGQRIEEKKHVFHYKDYLIYHLLDSISSEQNLKDFCNPLILQLTEYDSIYSTDYCQTLYYYIMSNMNITLISKFFDVHRNTIKYRLKKIEEILNISLDDMGIAVSFYITYKILNYLGKEV